MYKCFSTFPKLKFFGVLFSILLSATCLAQTANSITDKATPNKDWKIQSSAIAEITIEDEVIRPNVPSTLFGFNINYRQFQRQLWDLENQRVKDGIIEALKPFNGALYRYPGGLVANTFHWPQAIGNIEERTGQKTFFDKKPKKASFGIDEYLKFTQDVGGHPWYVLNIVSTGLADPMKEASVDEVAEHNFELAQYLNEHVDQKNFPLHLQLGNEVDRSKYRWIPSKYVERVSPTIEKIWESYPDMKFVAFLRDFRLRNKNKDSGFDEPEVFMQEVVNDLPMINDYSLHHYYDSRRTDGKSRTIPFWMKLLTRSVNTFKQQKGQTPNVWVTEHGRQSDSNKAGKDDTRRATSNLAGAISTADYLIALALIPEVKGAVLHGLNAGPWQLFDFSAQHEDLRPRPLYYGLRVLKQMNLDVGLKTLTKSPNLSGYKGGYDVRGAAFKNSNSNSLAIQVVNRYSDVHDLKINYQAFSGEQVEVMHYMLSTETDTDPEGEDIPFNIQLDPEKQVMKFATNGVLEVKLPPSSVSTFIIKKI